ncbi:hypothetical protein ACFGVS_25520 [Mucilaginibacter sp. AW1-7]|uniref:hypothetical protein n=1 Tax=Mucilaginibacter sp. AW1-7 TaxID=3349874 RepID=UPI003F73237F
MNGLVIKVYQGVSPCTRVFQAVPGRFTPYQGVSGRTRAFHLVPGCTTSYRYTQHTVCEDFEKYSDNNIPTY